MSISKRWLRQCTGSYEGQPKTTCHVIMKKLIAAQTHSIYLKPGEVLVTRRPVLVSTVLGSCVAITMFSASRGLGAICHAMLPENSERCNDLRYVDNALRYMCEKIATYGSGSDLVVKLFGGARVINPGERASGRKTVGDQNVARAEATLAALGFDVVARDTGGLQGRKLYFCTRSGDVFMRRLRAVIPSGNKGRYL